MSAGKFDAQRFFLKDTIRKRINFLQTAQSRGLAAPPLQKPCPPDISRVDLPDGAQALARLAKMPVGKAIAGRESLREYSADPLDLEELSALLWATQGVRQVLSPDTALRSVPSAGARHSFETYLVVNRVSGLTSGLYRYLPFDGKLAQLKIDPQIGRKAALASFGQGLLAAAAVAFFWTALPTRMEWRYDLAAHKVIAIDAGHVGQNLYLACEALGAGCCAVAAYDQDACDTLLDVNGNEEFTIYLAAVGRRR
ncbi:MAG: SagB/ThcOx family dehydrogenase [Deltaproteobacteria bacterium]|nr:SagB/ThcOx family dehydrogenase [Deltaproteobacteria bacterium]